jgi:hypothetical protein
MKWIVSALLALILAISPSWGLSTETMPESDNIELANQRCPDYDNSLMRAQQYVIEKAKEADWQDLKMIHIISDATVSQVLNFVTVLPTLSMAPRLEEVVKAETKMIMIVYAPSRPRAIFVFVDKSDCVIANGPIDSETTASMLKILEIPH